MDSNPWWRAAATGRDRLPWRATDPVLAVRAPFDLGFTCAISHSWTLPPTAARLVSVSCVPSRSGQLAIRPTCSQQHSAELLRAGLREARTGRIAFCQSS